ncbi:MAG TPA: glycine cleavage system aminomethyltransferase GcvT [Pirellulales bacterium]
MPDGLLRSPLHDWHVAQGGRLVEFGGWEMPVQYPGGIVAEHVAVRERVGLFDVSHMGRLEFVGPAAAAFLDLLLTADVFALEPGRVKYALVCNEAGGVLDDVLVDHLQDATGQSVYSLVVNASNRVKIVDWLGAHLAEFPQKDRLSWVDRTAETAMIALQGPQALGLLQPLCDVPLERMKYYWITPANVADVPCIVSRTGYTGEDGFELRIPVSAAPALVARLMEVGATYGISPAGLGCRDTLRLEAAMPLYGHELTETIDPVAAGLSRSIAWSKKIFIGREALLGVKERGPSHTRVGLELVGRRIPRQGFAVAAEANWLGEPIGEITSGTFSPTLQKTIAMAYVAPELATPGRTLFVDVRGTAEPATVVPLPFYKRPKPAVVTS